MPLRQGFCQTRGHVLGNSCHFRILDFTHSLERRLLLMIAPDRALVCRSRLERTNGVAFDRQTSKFAPPNAVSLKKYSDWCLSHCRTIPA
jgi:hypothetical protein